MQPNQNIRCMKWPANDSPLNTNPFWNWNVGILLIKIIIHQWSVLIKGLNWCLWGERNRTQQGSSASPSSSCPAAAGAPGGGKAREIRGQDAISSEVASRLQLWMVARISTDWNNFLWKMRCRDTNMFVKWLPWTSGRRQSAKMQGCLVARTKK